jgi:hypothetical protein
MITFKKISSKLSAQTANYSNIILSRNFITSRELVLLCILGSVFVELACWFCDIFLASSGNELVESYYLSTGLINAIGGRFLSVYVT